MTETEKENMRRAKRICGLFIDLNQYEYPQDWINPVLAILNEITAPNKD